jgi:hypothetical protein
VLQALARAIMPGVTMGRVTDMSRGTGTSRAAASSKGRGDRSRGRRTARTTIDRRTIRSRPDHQHEEADASEANNASRVGLFVEMGGQIVGANSLRCLLTAFHANDRQRDFPDQDLAQKFLDGEVTEIIAAHPLDRDRSERALLAISAPAQQFPVA